MIDEDWTWEFYGYHSDELSHASEKHIVARCDKCCQYRVLLMHDYSDLCHACVHKTIYLDIHGRDICKVCGDVLVDDNWTLSQRKRNHHLCKKCVSERRVIYRRKIGGRPMNENKECSAYLGVYIAERVLSKVFKDVQVMPPCNPGYDIICNHEKLIDIKSSAYSADGRWAFRIKKNKTPDYFICIAFDNRADLNPQHLWMIPGNVVNRLTSAAISKSNLGRWSQYEMPLDKVITCCDTLKGESNG